MTNDETGLTNQTRMTKPELTRLVIRASSLIRHSGFVILVLPLAAGCSSHKPPTTRPAGTYDRQEAALRDPFGYSVNHDADKPDISGGKIGEYNRDSMRKDVDHVLNP